LEEQLNYWGFPDNMPELKNLLFNITKLKNKFLPVPTADKNLTVEINSFSYKKSGIPYDISPNGGGFVFDCRALPNPGRLPQLRDYSGKDKPVIEYLEKFEEIEFFKKKVFGIVDQSIDNFLGRGFTRLQVNFGCTGGKHRSVYMAEALKSHLSRRDKVIVIINHKERDKA
jgi:RNase adaptor protein for sRNA GlmZ degradation